MKKIILNITCFVFILSFAACLNYETQEDGPYTDNDQIDLSKSVVYVSNGDVYLTGPSFDDKIIINSGNNTLASINNKHTKVLYKSPDKNIKIYDIESKTVDGDIPDTENAFWFDYHNNNETVYYLIGNDIFTYGKAVLNESPIRLTTLASYPNAVLNGAAIFNDNDILFSITDGFGNDVTNHLFFYKSSAEPNNAFAEVGVNGAVPRLEYFRFNKESTACWAIKRQTSQLYKFDVGNFIYHEGTDPNTIMGTPINFNNGILITSDNSINTFNQDLISFPTENITSIDF